MERRRLPMVNLKVNFSGSLAQSKPKGAPHLLVYDRVITDWISLDTLLEPADMGDNEEGLLHYISIL